MNKGHVAAFAAFIFWGLSPLYWKLLSHFPAYELILDRIILSLPFLLLLKFLRGGKKAVSPFLKEKKLYLPFILSAFLLAGNWFIFIWSVNNNYVVEASLGYFLNPLLNVLLGVLFLHENLRKMEWLAIIIAAFGVLYLAVNYGRFPWIALALAGSFAIYGFIRKTARLEALEGLTLEVTIMFLPALLLFFYAFGNGEVVIFDSSLNTILTLILVGAVTSLPLIWFAYAARKIPLSTVGLIQYIAPTLQFLIGVFIFGEEFTQQRFIGFSLIWLALTIYSSSNLIRVRRGF